MEHAGEPLTVMTRNLYLGADINRSVLAAVAAQQAGGTERDVLLALAHATHEGREIVDRTDFRVRAHLLARELAGHRPDLVGLQEVALWRSGPLGLDRLGVPDAARVDYDFLGVLLEALAEQGARYEPIAVGERADVEAPSFTGSPFDGTSSPDARDVRLTMRDVILQRSDLDVDVVDQGDALFAANLSVRVGGATMSFARGYQWVDLRLGDETFRFVNTHLEAFSSDLAVAQAAELLANAPAPDRTTVIACDCNSDPTDDSVRTGDTQPGCAAYDLITGAGGFTDEWLEWDSVGPGWTCGLSELVDDPSGAGLDHRIDMIFARTAEGSGLPVEGGAVTGAQATDRDPATGLWPSDHGGVVLRLRGL